MYLLPTGRLLVDDYELRITKRQTTGAVTDPIFTSPTKTLPDSRYIGGCEVFLKSHHEGERFNEKEKARKLPRCTQAKNTLLIVEVIES
jgi:hypothetical protein